MIRIVLPRVLPAATTLLLALAACSPRPAYTPTPVPETAPSTEPRPAAPEGDPLERSVRRLLAAGLTDRAEQIVRDELRSGEARESAGELRLLLGEILEAAGRDEEALLTYSEVSGVPGGEGVAAGAWEGVARVRAAAGDRRGEARALLKAWERADDRERRRLRSRLEESLRALPPADLAALTRDRHALPPDGVSVLQEVASADEPAEVVIALLAPLSGRFAQFGQAFRLGAELALAARDTLTAPPVRLVIRDTAGDLLTASQAARTAIVEDGARVLVGPLLSIAAIGAGAVAQSYRIPLVTPTATDPRLTDIGPCVVTLMPSPRELARPLAEFSTTVLGNARHGVLVGDDESAAALEAEFRATVEALGGEVSFSLALESGQRDFRRLIERIADAGLDAIYVTAPVAELNRFAAQLEFYEVFCQILGNAEWLDPSVLDPGNLALEGAILAVAEADHPWSDFSLGLRAAIWERTRAEVSRFHTRGYLALVDVLTALERGARDAEEILETVRRRELWDERPAGRRPLLLAFRDGVLGPAEWAVGFDLKGFPPPPEDEEEEADADAEEAEGAEDAALPDGLAPDAGEAPVEPLWIE